MSALRCSRGGGLRRRGFARRRLNQCKVRREAIHRFSTRGNRMADASISAAEPRQPEPEPGFEANGDAWEAAEDAIGTQEALVVSLDGFEGPLDVLLALARTQKVDLAKISV